MQSASISNLNKGPRPGIEPIISVHKVSKHFGKGEPTIKDLNFEVKRGEIFCLLGPSGSGKSTTMRMLNGVYKPSEGEVRVLGVEPHNFKKRTRARIGYMPQLFVLFPELTTLENLNFVASVYGMNWFGRGQNVRRALEFVDLWDARNRLASQLSGGMQRRLELASVLVHTPELIFVDEPTAGIDPVLRAKFWEQFKSLRDNGETLFVTTQYVTEADYCDTVAILNRGRLLALGTPESIRYDAMGGEIINLSLEEITSQAVRILKSIPDMLHIKIVTTEDLRLTVKDAGEALQEIVTVFNQNNIEITSIEPYRPDFEEVFVKILEKDVDPEEEEKAHHNGKKENKDAGFFKTGKAGINQPQNDNPGYQAPPLYPASGASAGQSYDRPQTSDSFPTDGVYLPDVPGINNSDLMYEPGFPYGQPQNNPSEFQPNLSNPAPENNLSGQPNPPYQSYYNQPETPQGAYPNQFRGSAPSFQPTQPYPVENIQSQNRNPQNNIQEGFANPDEKKQNGGQKQITQPLRLKIDNNPDQTGGVQGGKERRS